MKIHERPSSCKNERRKSFNLDRFRVPEVTIEEVEFEGTPVDESKDIGCGPDRPQAKDILEFEVGDVGNTQISDSNESPFPEERKIKVIQRTPTDFSIHVRSRSNLSIDMTPANCFTNSLVVKSKVFTTVALSHASRDRRSSCGDNFFSEYAEDNLSDSVKNTTERSTLNPVQIYNLGIEDLGNTELKGFRKP